MSSAREVRKRKNSDFESCRIKNPIAIILEIILITSGVRASNLKTAIYKLRNLMTIQN